MTPSPPASPQLASREAASPAPLKGKGKKRAKPSVPASTEAGAAATPAATEPGPSQAAPHSTPPTQHVSPGLTGEPPSRVYPKRILAEARKWLGVDDLG